MVAVFTKPWPIICPRPSRYSAYQRSAAHDPLRTPRGFMILITIHTAEIAATIIKADLETSAKTNVVLGSVFM